jgi:hypothetical protein
LASYWFRKFIIQIIEQRRLFQSITRCKSIITQCFKLVIDLIGPRLTMSITEPLRHRSSFLPTWSSPQIKYETSQLMSLISQINYATPYCGNYAKKKNNGGLSPMTIAVLATGLIASKPGTDWYNINCHWSLIRRNGCRRTIY